MPNDPAMTGQAWCLGVIQMRVEPGDPAANLAWAGDLARRAVQSGAGLVLFPEVMDCGWTHPSAAVPGRGLDTDFGGAPH